jgi:hypothetical protein
VTPRSKRAYTKNKIGNDKKAALESEQASYNARMDGLRNKATETRDRIRGKLTAFLESVKVKRPERIEAEHVEEPEFLPIPDNLSPKRKAYLQRQNSLRYQKYSREVDAAEEVASIANKSAMEAYGVAREAAAKSSSKARDDAKVERERVGSELKTAVSNARNAYAEAKKQLIAKYEATTNTEYDNIRSKLPGAPPKAAKSKTAAKAKAKTAAKSKTAVPAKAAVQTKAEARPKAAVQVQTPAATDPKHNDEI